MPLHPASLASTSIVHVPDTRTNCLPRRRSQWLQIDPWAYHAFEGPCLEERQGSTECTVGMFMHCLSLRRLAGEDSKGPRHVHHGVTLHDKDGTRAEKGLGSSAIHGSLAQVSTSRSWAGSMEQTICITPQQGLAMNTRPLAAMLSNTKHRDNVNMGPSQ